MPKVPQPAKPPESISPTLWNGENREDILAFLGDLNGAYLFYQVMKGDPDPKSSAIDEANATKVDKITNMHKAQYLAQADSMFLSETTQTPVKKAPNAGDEEEIAKQFAVKADESINFYKIPAGVYGQKDLQKGLYMLLRSMAKANYSATISGVSSTSPDCGTKLLTLLNDTISPESKATKDQAKEAYTTHKDTFTNNTNFVPWWTTLLLLQTTKATLGITPSTRTDALEDACDTIEHKCGHESRWGFEVCRWRLKSDGERAEKARKGRDMTDEDMVASFENHMRLYQQRRDLSAKEKANAVNLKSDYCAWCFKNKGVKWNNHTESTCRNKKRAEGGDHGNAPGSGGGGEAKNGRGCHACGSKDHFVKDCPLVVKARALQACVNENATTTNFSAENKTSAGVPSTYSEPPPLPPRQTQKRNPTASALMTTALLASAASSPASCTPMMANFASAATDPCVPSQPFRHRI